MVEHHERYDGTRTTRLKAHEISLAARIVAVADTYEVMTAPRPYKRSMGVEAARQELTRVAGTQLDPGIVRAFLNISVGRLWRTLDLVPGSVRSPPSAVSGASSATRVPGSHQAR